MQIARTSHRKHAETPQKIKAGRKLGSEIQKQFSGAYPLSCMQELESCHAGSIVVLHVTAGMNSMHDNG